MFENGGHAIARTTDGIVAMFENGFQAFVRMGDQVSRSGRSLFDVFGDLLRGLPIIG